MKKQVLIISSRRELGKELEEVLNKDFRMSLSNSEALEFSFHSKQELLDNLFSKDFINRKEEVINHPSIIIFIWEEYHGGIKRAINFCKKKINRKIFLLKEIKDFLGDDLVQQPLEKISVKDLIQRLPDEIWES